MKEEINSKKDYSKSKKKKNVTAKAKTFAFTLFYWFWTGFCCLSSFVYFFFPLLSINHKHKCI